MSKWESFPADSLDFETTGVDPLNDRVVSAAWVHVPATGRPTIRTWLVDSGVEIPAEAAAVHGITTEHAREHGTDPSQMLFELTGLVALALGHGNPVVVYNAPFDLTLLEAENARHGIDSLESRLGPGGISPIVDPMVLASYAEPYRKRICTCGCGATDKTLGGWCLHYAVPHIGAHGADGDALAAVRLWRRIMAKHPKKFPAMTLPALHQAQIGWKKSQADGLRDFWKRTEDERWRDVDGSWPIRRVEAGAPA